MRSSPRLSRALIAVFASMTNAVSTVHEQMDHYASEHQDPGQRCDDMGLVLGPQQVHANTQE
jgi:hypothetical protein